MHRTLVIVLSGAAICAGIVAARAVPQSADSRTLLTGQAAFATAELEKPGIFRHITVADLPAPFATPSATNQSNIIPRPANAWPQAFYPPGPNPQYVYVGNTNSVVRFPYANGDLKARGPAEVIVKTLPSGDSADPNGGGHWTRDIVFRKTAKNVRISVGSAPMWTIRYAIPRVPPR
jgi:hypothetical protein